MTKHLTLCLLATGLGSLSAEGAPQPGHDEITYGKRLSYQRVEGVGPCMAAEVAGNRLYAIGQGTLYVLDITRPQAPQLLGKVGGLGNTRQIAVKGSYAYVTARQDGLWIVDITVPAQPKVASHYDSVEMATGIWVAGTLAFVAQRQYGVEIVDISDPKCPRHVSILKTPEAQSCWTRDNLLYVGDWHSRQVNIADITDPRKPIIIGSAELDGYGDGGCLRGKYCFAATGHHSRAANQEEAYGKGHGLEIWDVSTPSSPTLVSRVKFPQFYSLFIDMWSARVAGDYCVVADTHNGLFVLDIHDLAKPAIIAHAQLPPMPGKSDADPVGGVALGQDVIYAAGVTTGLYVVFAPGLASAVVPEEDHPPVLSPLATPPEDPRFEVYRPDGQVHNVAVQGDVAWIACGAAGIQAVRLGGTLAPAMIHPTADEVGYVTCCGNRLYTAESMGGMGIYEIGPDLRLTEVGRLKLPGRGVRQVMVPEPGHFGLLHCGGATAFVVDLRDIKNPRVAFSDSQVGLFYGDQLVNKLFDGRYLVAYWQRSGPAWYDISGDQPVLAGNTPDSSLYSFTDGVCPYGDSLLLIKGGKYTLLSANERRSVSVLPAYGVEGLRLAGWPATDGKTLALSSRHGRSVTVLDISDFAHPKLLHRYELAGNPGVCGFFNGRLVIPAAYQGLLVERRNP